MTRHRLEYRYFNVVPASPSAIETLLLICLAFAAAIVRGYAGFGFSAIVITAGSLFFAPASLVPVLYLLEIVASLHMFRYIRTALDYRLLIYILAGCAISLPVGQYFLVSLPADVTRAFVYISVLFCAVLVFRGYRFRTRMTTRLGLFGGVLIGLGSGLGSIGGLPAMVIFLGTGYEAAKTRAIFVATFLFLYIVGSVITYYNGLLNGAAIYRAVWMAPPLIAGIYIGNRFFTASSSSSYRKVALALMITLSLFGLLRLMVRTVV